ncbi:MAG: ABC transporter ATP-binding protein [Acidobacteriota bacterium]
MPEVDIEGLTKDYAIGFWRKRPYRALDGVTLQVGAGEVFGFLGPNGAGKTTTLKLLMQLIYPTSGRMSILGRPAGDIEVRRRIGYLPEAPYFYDHLTAEELLIYVAGVFGLRGEERRRRAAALLDRVGIGGERRLPLRRFSKGMLQRVGLAQALVNQPDVVFLDEPMSGLDPLGRRDVRTLILELRDRGCTVFFSSHILSDAETLCSRVGVIVAGRMVASGRLTDILAFEVTGWELVMSGIDADALRAIGDTALRTTCIGEGRFAIELKPECEPERVIAALRAPGATLVSLTPIRKTLEDFFVEQVRAGHASLAAGRVVGEG